MNAAVTIKASGRFSVNFQAAAKTGATKRNVTASCVFPEGIVSVVGFEILDCGFGGENAVSLF